MVKVTMVKVTCVKCMVALYPFKNGVWVVETYSRPPTPYRIVRADVWACPVCDARITTGYSEPTAQHEPSFKSLWERIKETASVEDGTLIIQYERVTDAQTYGKNLPDVPVGVEHAPPIQIVSLDDDELDRLIEEHSEIK